MAGLLISQCKIFLYYNLVWEQENTRRTCGGNPRMCSPNTFKRVIREIIPGNLVARTNPGHDRVSSKLM